MRRITAQVNLQNLSASLRSLADSARVRGAGARRIAAAGGAMARTSATGRSRVSAAARAAGMVRSLVSGAAGAAAVALSIATLATIASAGTPDAAAQGSRVSPCRLWPSKIAAPGRLPLGATTTVTLTSSVGCPPDELPLHVVLVIDASDSMQDDAKILHAKRAAVAFIDGVNFEVAKVGVVSFNRDARIRTELTANPAEARTAVNSITLAFGTDIGAGIQAGQDVLVQGRPERESPDSPLPLEVMVVLSDGLSSAGDSSSARSAAGTAKGEGIQLASVCLGDDCDAVTMAAIASHRDLFFAGEKDELIGIYEAIADRLLVIALREYVIRDHVPENMVLDVASIQPPPDDVTDGVITWRFVIVPTGGITMTYVLTPGKAGRWPTNDLAVGVFRDSSDRLGSVTFPVPFVDVFDDGTLPSPTPTAEITATPVPTLTRTPTATSSPTPTATQTPSATPTATATRTPPVSEPPIFLPYVEASRCEPSRRAADVVLVIDSSTSMLERPTSPEASKLDAAVRSSESFLDTLDFPRDRAAIVTFNRTATLMEPLGFDRAALREALHRIEVDRGTRLDTGLELAGHALADARPRSGAQRAVILLTDGYPSEESEDDAIRAAEELRGSGIDVYTVGLGADVNPTLLRRIATRSAYYFPAPTTTELEAIYRAIAELIPCPS